MRPETLAKLKKARRALDWIGIIGSVVAIFFVDGWGMKLTLAGLAALSLWFTLKRMDERLEKAIHGRLVKK